MSNLMEETVVGVRHRTDRLFSFRTTRDPSFRFRNGEFTMIGIKVDGKPLLRAYSVASANYEEQLEFLSIKVPDGPLSVIKDPETYERFDKVILVHGVRHVAELAFQDEIADHLPKDELLGELVASKLLYYPTVTREPFRHTGRITALLETGRLQDDLGLAPLAGAEDRVMICGGPHMMAELRAFLLGRAFVEGNHGEPGHFVVEKAFVDRS